MKNKEVKAIGDAQQKFEKKEFALFFCDELKQSKCYKPS